MNIKKHYFLIIARLLYIAVLGLAAFFVYKEEGASSWVFWGVCGFVLIATISLFITIKMRKTS